MGNGTAPVEVSSGGKKACRLSLRGNRRLNHTIHMAAISQIRHKRSQGRAYYDKKLAEGKTHKEALRSLKRRISDAIYAALVADARQAAAASTKGPGGQPGTSALLVLAFDLVLDVCLGDRVPPVDVPRVHHHADAPSGDGEYRPEEPVHADGRPDRTAHRGPVTEVLSRQRMASKCQWHDRRIWRSCH